MKILSALFDVVLLPVSMAKDCVDLHNHIEGNDSYTRQRIEKIENELGL